MKKLFEEEELFFFRVLEDWEIRAFRTGLTIVEEESDEASFSLVKRR